MSERISRDEVARVAHLARIRLDDTELDSITRRLDAILDRSAGLADLDLDDVEPTSHPHDLRNVWRPDETGPTLTADEALAAAPAHEDGQFSVPTILGEAP